MTLRIARQDLQAKLSTRRPPVLVEALGSGYWTDAHLPGALNIPADQVDRLAPRLLPDLEAEIIIYGSATSQNADVAARRLHDLGYQRVLVYAGGKEDWIENGLPVERGVTAPESSRDTTDLSVLDDLVEQVATGRLLPDVHRCVLRVETPNTREAWTAAATTNPHDEHAMHADAAFRIASVTKMVTATALLALVDQRRCELDDPTGRHLPSEVVGQFRDSEGRTYAADITLRQLLDHTSGLPNYFFQQPIVDAVFHGDGRRRFTPRDLLTLAAAEAPPASPPGAERAYTDTGFVLAGLIIESLTGDPLHQAYRDLVLDPAGMGDTWLESSTDAPRRAIAPHELDGQDITDMDPTVDWAGGGLVSTAADLAAFLQALKQGRLVSRRAWNEMTHWQPGPPGYYDYYGLGLGRYQFDSAQAIGHHGAWGAFAFWCPELDASITGTINTARVDRRPLLNAVVDAIAEAS